MRRYETIFIIDPDLSEEERSPLFERLKDMIPQYDGLLVMTDEWGTKKLAYEIKKKSSGYYVRLDYCGTGTLVSEIERFFRIDDRVLKYMTVLFEKDVDVERVKEEIARAEAKEVQSEQSDEPNADINDKPDVDPKISDVPESEAVENEILQSVINIKD